MSAYAIPAGVVGFLGRCALYVLLGSILFLWGEGARIGGVQMLLIGGLCALFGLAVRGA